MHEPVLQLARAALLLKLSLPLPVAQVAVLVPSDKGTAMSLPEIQKIYVNAESHKRSQVSMPRSTNAHIEARNCTQTCIHMPFTVPELPCCCALPFALTMLWLTLCLLIQTAGAAMQ